MFVAFVAAAIVIALVVGIVVGRLVVAPRFPGRRPAVAVSSTQDSDATTSTTARTKELVFERADAPRAVPDSAELRISDVRATTDDGRMTRAGLLSLIVSNTETAVAVVDEFRDVVLYSHRAIDLGMVRDQLLADAVWEAAKDVLDTEEQRRFEFSPPASSLGFVSSGRTRKPAVESVRCLARLVAHQGERYAVVYGQDDTEHMRVEATRRDFVANVSHELKTPVGAIGLLAEAMLESADDADSVQHFGRRVVAESARMGNMVSELIALSRLQGGETAEFTSVDVDALIDDAIESATIAAEAAAIAMRADDPIGVTVRGDRTLLLTALNNLIANAISYSPAATTVSISRRVTRVDGRPMVAIAVTDRGIGIAPDDQQRVFERFFRVDQARSRMTGGTGLGLAIVKHVAANHGGVIKLWSKPGTGSTFTLCIPEDLSDAAWIDEVHGTDAHAAAELPPGLVDPESAAVTITSHEPDPQQPTEGNR